MQAARDSAEINRSTDPLLQAVRFRSLGPASMGGRIDDIEVSESNPNVMRYAWFNATPIASARLTNADGSLTDLGTTYVGLPQNCN